MRLECVLIAVTLIILIVSINANDMLMKVTVTFISISFNSVVTKYNVHPAQPEVIKQTRLCHRQSNFGRHTSGAARHAHARRIWAD